MLLSGFKNDRLFLIKLIVFVSSVTVGIGGESKRSQYKRFPEKIVHVNKLPMNPF